MLLYQLLPSGLMLIYAHIIFAFDYTADLVALLYRQEIF